jgi:HNH endonuclease
LAECEAKLSGNTLKLQCNNPAPFKTVAGTAYLEPHHIRRLTDGGPDDRRFVGAVCPNCHREIHHGQNGSKLNESLQAAVLKKEKDGPVNSGGGTVVDNRSSPPTVFV